MFGGWIYYAGLCDILGDTLCNKGIAQGLCVRRQAENDIGTYLEISPKFLIKVVHGVTSLIFITLTLSADLISFDKFKFIISTIQFI